jgi:hypothetical protein
MKSPFRTEEQPPTWVRRVGWMPSAAIGVFALVEGSVIVGLGFLALGLGAISLGRRQQSPQRERAAGMSFEVLKAFAFFSAISLAGLAGFVLALLGSIPAPTGALGGLAAVGGVYMIVSGIRFHSR